MNILKWVQKVPGGILIVPLLVCAIINTVFPDALKIGNPTTAMFTGAGSMTIIGIILFIAGTQLKVKKIGTALKRGGGLLALKIILGFIMCFALIALCGWDGFLGIPTMALVIAIMSGNTGVYIALCKQFGDIEDITAIGILNLETIPALPVMVLSLSATGTMDVMSLVAALVPFVLGCILGNLDINIEKLMAPGMTLLLVFLGCTFGSNINLVNVVTAGPSGLLLTAIYLVISIPVHLLFDRYVLRRPGYAGVAFCSVAGITVMIPALAAAALPELAPYVEVSMLQLAMAVVITPFITSFVTKWVAKKFGDGRFELTPTPAIDADQSVQPAES